ncbi:MAG: phosphodiester glycosidase family protein [Peptococcaceae bacterium]|nr:phosphodiester glycosidase family protein [Peptococcaceae bacterium]
MSKKTVVFFIVFNMILSLLSAPLVIFYGPYESLRLFTVGTIVTSRHPQIAQFFLPQTKIDEIAQSYGQKTMSVEPVIMNKGNVVIDQKNCLQIEEIQGKYFKGKVMLVRDPHQVQVAATRELGTAGQRLSQIVSENGAIAGINAGGFYDPNAQGNGAYPDGITVVNHQVIHNRSGNDPVDLIAFDSQGKLVLEKMNISEVVSRNIQNAVSFYPNLVVEGKPQINGDGGWGLAPRTGVGQKADGTVIFVVIDGRQPGRSMGATLRDLMNVFIEYGAVNAANLDGGSSTEMVYNGQIVNRLWNLFGERYIPTAFIVIPSKAAELNLEKY